MSLRIDNGERATLEYADIALSPDALHRLLAASARLAPAQTIGKCY